MAGNRQAQWIGAATADRPVRWIEATDHKQARWTAAVTTDHKQAQRIGEAAARIASVIEVCPAAAHRAEAELSAGAARVATVAAAREPAVLGGPPAWVLEAAAHPGVADGGDRQAMIKEKYMRLNTFSFFRSRALVVAHVIALSCFLMVLAGAESQSNQTAAAASKPVQTSFATPKQAAEALIQAAANYDVSALTGMFGPDGKDIVSSADAVEDKNSQVLSLAL